MLHAQRTIRLFAAADQRMALGSLLLGLLLFAVPVPMLTVPAAGMAGESEVPLEEQREVEEVFASTSAVLRRQPRHAALRALQRRANNCEFTCTHRPPLCTGSGHRLTNGLCAPLLR